MPDFSDRTFVERYASFLVAAHQSFDGAAVRLPRWWDVKSRRSARKPWRPVMDAALRQSAEPDGMILEFGVFRGDSIRHLARRRPNSAIHGFDSFEGFPDDNRADWRQDFSVATLPVVPDNVTLHQGFFDQTVPPFVELWRQERPSLALVHIDCDIFSSTQIVLDQLGSFLRPGDVIVFDELMNYTEFAANEFLAFYLLLDRIGLDFEWAATWGRAYPLLETEGRMLDVGFDGYRAAGFFQNQAVRLKDRGTGTHFNAPAASPALVERLRGALADVPDGVRV